MTKRFFPGAGAQISEVGLGCWQLGGTDWGVVDDDTAFDILGTAVDTGVTFFDTAGVYGGGRSETLIGRFLKDYPGRIYVGTKLGRDADLYPDKYTEAGVRAATEGSLRRLGVESLDLTQLHCIPETVLRRGEVFDWLRQLQKEGKIRHFGASVESMDEALFCLEQDGLASLQIIFNLFRQKPARVLFDLAQAKGVGLIVCLPLASGLLAGIYTKETQFGANDHRAYNRDGQAFNVGETFAGLPYELGVELADQLKAFVPEGFTLADFAQRWILDHAAVSVIIPGASRVEQVRRNTAVSVLPPLKAEIHRQLADFYDREVAAHIRGPY